jgi:hypothetical protein
MCVHGKGDRASRNRSYRRRENEDTMGHVGIERDVLYYMRQPGA